MRYSLTPIHCRPWLLNSLSHKLTESHYENNYGGALRRLNVLTEKLEALDLANTPPYVLNQLKRDQLTALNSTLLHELYWAGLGGDGKPNDAMKAILARDFGTYERWRDEFVRMGYGLGGGSGWVILSYVPRDAHLVNHLANDHGDCIAGGIPILALDMYEHAYAMDFGANATSYVDTIMRNLDWQALQARYEDASGARAPRPLEQPEFGDVPAVSPEAVQAMFEAGQPVQVIDGRPRHYMTRSTEIMDGAKWRDPDRMQEWVGELRKEVPVVTFCAYGFHVGCRMAVQLRELGFDASFMQGGHSAWKAMGGKIARATTD